jgi:hypothetical protein
MPHPSLSPHLNIDALPFMRMNEIFGCVETLAGRDTILDEFAGSFLLAIGRVVVISLRRRGSSTECRDKTASLECEKI